MDKLDTIKTFIRVVDSGSFTRAADLLNLPKSTVSRQIQALESSLGVKLLHRTSRRLTMTELGEAYYQGAVRLVEQSVILDSNIQASSVASRGKIRVEMPNAIAYCKIIPALPDFLGRYPDVQVEVSVGNKTIDLIQQSIDCVIRVGDLQNDALIARSLGTLEMVTCASPDYLQQRGTPRHPRDLLKEHTLVQIVSPLTSRVFEQLVFSPKETVAISGQWQFAVNDSTAARTAALAGLGVVTTYRFLVEEALENGQLTALFPDWRGETVSVHIAWPESRHLPSKVRYFIDWVIGLFST